MSSGTAPKQPTTSLISIMHSSAALAILALSTSSYAASIVGNHESVSAGYVWTEDVNLAATTVNNRAPLQTGVSKYTVDLDAPAESRWDHVAKDFVDVVPDAIAYLKAFIPPWAFPLIVSL